jgi:amino acid adenylation domain-containing protein
VVDLRAVSDGEKEARAMRLVAQDAHRPFDLAQGPLFRATLVQLAAEDYILLLNMHHIISDGWSMRVFLQELAALYAAFAIGKPSPLPELPIQYADFAVWQRQWLQGEVLERQLSYWKQQLGGSPPMLELPTDRLRSAVQTYRGARQSLLLPKPLSDALRALSQRQGVTLFMTLLAAFQTLLHRHTGQDDLWVGAPIAGRTRTEIEGLIGFFVNTLVLRTDLSGNPPFQELLGRVREVALAAYAHQELPFERLVEALQPQRQLSHPPLFQVFFNMLNLQDNRITLPGLAVEALSAPDVEAKFDVTLYVRERSESLQFELVYNADLFEPRRMGAMLEQLHHLLTQIVDHPEARLAQFSLVTPTAEALLPNPAQALCSDWLGGAHRRFAQQARRVPQRPAVVDAHEVWSYAELEAWSNRLANYLRARGIQQQDVVAIYAHRSASLVWALLGVLKAGAAFTILDPAYPASRLIDCLRLAAPRGWIQMRAAGPPPEALEEFLATLSWRCRLELPQRTAAEVEALLQGYSTDNPGDMVGPDDLAYVVFTSGSTGKPKGILGAHRPISHFLAWYSQAFGLSASDRFGMLSGLSHDPLLRDILTPLWLGGTLCIPDPESLWSPGRLSDWMRQQELSVVHLTPAMGQLLTDMPSSSAAGTSEAMRLRSLRYACFGGDVLTKRHVAKLQALAPSAACVNFYGATETPQAMGYFIIPSAEDRDRHPGPEQEQLPESIPLGRGIQDVQLLVLNGARRLAGIGEPGEIYVRTPYLAQGYVDDEALTHERFIANPFTATAGDRLYRTGDLGRYLPDGAIQFLGRRDHQVNIRGFRIELGEIEAVLDQHPAVRQTAVVARQDATEDTRLVAYMTPRQSPPPPSETLRRFLEGRLPHYMVPATYVWLDALPLTPHGKVDRRALPTPDLNLPRSARTRIASRNTVERQLTGIWEQVLGVHPIGVQDNFFDLGGHSLLAVRLFAHIERVVGQRLPLASLFQAPTIEAQAALLGGDSWTTPWTSLVAVQPAGSRRPFFCVHAHDGHVLYYRHLAMHLGLDQPFYGLQAQGLDGQLPPHTCVADMAAHYVKEIRLLQPDGPYCLGANCGGGMVAFEMAQQLCAQGHKVGLLAMIDAHARGCHVVRPGGVSRRARALRLWQKVDEHCGNLAILAPRDRLAYLRGEADWLVKTRLKPGLHRLIGGWARNHRSASSLSSEAAITSALPALEPYVPTAYPGRVTLFRSSKLAAGLTHDPQFGWGRLAMGGVEVHAVPGYHGIIHEPRVRLLAARLHTCLDRVQVPG